MAGWRSLLGCLIARRLVGDKREVRSAGHSRLTLAAVFLGNWPARQPARTFGAHRLLMIGAWVHYPYLPKRPEGVTGAQDAKHKAKHCHRSRVLKIAYLNCISKKS